MFTQSKGTENGKEPGKDKGKKATFVPLYRQCVDTRYGQRRDKQAPVTLTCVHTETDLPPRTCSC